MHFIWPNGKGALLTGIEKERPSYERLMSALQGVPGSKASRSWVDRVNPFSGVRHNFPKCTVFYSMYNPSRDTGSGKPSLALQCTS